MQPPGLYVGSACLCMNVYEAQHRLRNICIGVEGASRTSVWHIWGTSDAANEVEAVGNEEGHRETKGQEEHVDGNKRASDLGGSYLAVVDGL